MESFCIETPSVTSALLLVSPVGNRFPVPEDMALEVLEQACGGGGTYDAGSIEVSCRSAARQDSAVRGVPPLFGQSEYTSVKTFACPTWTFDGMKNDRVI